MTTDLDIYRSAKLLIDRHGQDATHTATRRADELLDAGDLDGQAAWPRISAAEEPLRHGPLPHHRIN